MEQFCLIKNRDTEINHEKILSSAVIKEREINLLSN